MTRLQRHLSSLLPVLLAAHSAVAASKSYKGYSLVSYLPQTQSELDELKQFVDTTEYVPYRLRQVDVWSFPRSLNTSVEFLVAPSYQAELLSLFPNISATIKVKDVQKSIDAEQRRGNETLENLAWSRVLRDMSSKPFSFDRYHTLAEIHTYMRWLANNYPSFVQITPIGRGHEGNDILVMQIASPKGETSKKPAIWLDGGIHAREWIAPATVLYFITELVQGYERKDRKSRVLVDRLLWFHSTYFLPVMNPDGYKYSFENDRMWRKNRRPESCPLNSAIVCCDIGVDLNRNFDWHHCGSGSSTNPCSETFCGPNPLSEPEAVAVANYINALKSERNLMGYLSFHSYSQYWMYPYGHAVKTYTENLAELHLVALKAVRQLKMERGTKYKVGTAADLLYEAAGGSDDWAHGKAGIRFSYLIELAPCDSCAEEFLLPASEIRGVGAETWRAVKTVATHIIRVFSQQRRARRIAAARRRHSRNRKDRARFNLQE